jgi:hypothetical protein
MADALVVEALFTSATGLDNSGKRSRKKKQQVVKLEDDDFTIVELEEDIQPKFEAQKYWLNNRQPQYWGEKLQVGGDRSPGAAPIGVRDETKAEVMASILNMISPKPDNPGV